MPGIWPGSLYEATVNRLATRSGRNAAYVAGGHAQLAPGAKRAYGPSCVCSGLDGPILVDVRDRPVVVTVPRDLFRKGVPVDA